MSDNLLVTKLFIPPGRRTLVPRPRLVQLLNEAWQQNRKLTLVSASAGYGKTTLVTEWLHGIEARTAFLFPKGNALLALEKFHPPLIPAHTAVPVLEFHG